MSRAADFSWQIPTSAWRGVAAAPLGGAGLPSWDAERRRGPPLVSRFGSSRPRAGVRAGGRPPRTPTLLWRFC